MGLNLLKILAKVAFHNALISLSYRLYLARSDAEEHKNNRRSEQSANAVMQPIKPLLTGKNPPPSGIDSGSR